MPHRIPAASRARTRRASGGGDVEKVSLWDRLGPSVSSGLIIAVVSALAIGAVALRDMVNTSSVEQSHLISDVAQLRKDLDVFRSPGDRFTAADGQRHATMLASNKDEIERLRDTVSGIRERVSVIEHEAAIARLEREKICERIKQCQD